MMKEVSLQNTIYITDKLLDLTRTLCDENIPNRYLALYDLTKKMRACMDALIPISKHDILCVPTNILYRCMITDLLTSLLITVVDEDEFKKVQHLMDFLYARSLWTALKAETDVKKDVYPNDAKEFERQRLDYLAKQYDLFHDCLKSSKGEEWVFITKPTFYIREEKFDGSVDSTYKVLLKFPEVKAIASVYEYYKLFSQSEHFSIKNRIFIV